MSIEFLTKTSPADEAWRGAMCEPGQTIRELWGDDTAINAWINGVPCSQFVIENARVRSGQRVTAIVSPEVSAIAAIGGAIAAGASAVASSSFAGVLASTALSAGISVIGPLTESVPK